jgi:plasmid stabilization system protein ParE
VAEVVFHPEAKAEYVDAIIWYEQRSARASDRFEAEVETALDRICAAPDSFPRYEDVHRFTSRASLSV